MTVCARLLIALAVIGCRREAPLPRLEAPLSLLARPTADGGTLDPSGYRGKVVALNFWSPG
jgi:hypothetical protein